MQWQRLESREDGECRHGFEERMPLHVYVAHYCKLERGLYGRDVWCVIDVTNQFCVSAPTPLGHFHGLDQLRLLGIGNWIFINWSPVKINSKMDFCPTIRKKTGVEFQRCPYESQLISGATARQLMSRRSSFWILFQYWKLLIPHFLWNCSIYHDLSNWSHIR